MAQTPVDPYAPPPLEGPGHVAPPIPEEPPAVPLPSASTGPTALTPYAALQAAVATRLGRPDLAPEIPDYIALAEARLRRVLRTKETVARASAVLDQTFSAVPVAFGGVISFRVVGSCVAELEGVDASVFDRVRSEGLLGQPRVYTIIGGEFGFHPAPDRPYTAELIYRRKLTPLSEAAPTNWLLAEHPDIYLYGALIQAETRLVEDERLPIWKRFWDEALTELAGTAREATAHQPRLATELAWPPAPCG